MTPGESFAMLSPMMYLLSLFLLTIPVYAACPEKVDVLANEGDKFVIVKLNGKEWKLTSTQAFSYQAKTPVTFLTKGNDPMKGEPTLEFEMPSMVMSSLPRLTISYSGRQDKCRVNIYGPADKKQN